MKSLLWQPALTLTFAGLSYLSICQVAAHDCPLYTWTWDDTPAAATMTGLISRPEVTPYPGRAAVPQPGELNCRSVGQTFDNVGYWSCNQLAGEFSITIERFWELNPQLAPDCDGIAPNTEYCVSGLIEPVRDTDGLCGPSHNNATCTGSDFGQCCNAETWTCGETDHDCSWGVCYEGQCAGHKIYTTDGNCGYTYEHSQCAGKWGDCCNFEGRCGTGEEFCGKTKCQSGNCQEWR